MSKPIGGFLDLDTMVKNWAWREYDRTATKAQKKLREKEKRKPGTYLNIKFDWSEVKFNDVTSWPRVAEGDMSDKNENTIAQATNEMKKAEGGQTAASVLFMTTFKNDTQEQQEYTMKTEKTTQSAISTEIESGYTHGIEMSMTLKTPGEIFEANAGFSREYSVTNTDGQTFEEAVTWGVESVIKVKENHVADARLLVEEKKFSGNFEVTSTIKGIVYVMFTNIRDNNSAVKMVANDMTDIVRRHLETQRRIGEPLEFVEVDDLKVTVTSKGCCQFRFGIKQEVVVHQEPITPTRNGPRRV